MNVSIDIFKYQILDIFKLLKSITNISKKEILKTFNLCMGLTIVAKKDYANDILKHMKKNKRNAYIIREIVKGNKKVKW